jgi:hypothetical protein
MRSFRHPCLDTLVLAVILTAISLAGCKPGPAIGEVRGKVTYKGKPVSEGTITFINPSGGGSGDAQLGPDGSYEIKGGLVVGDYIVIVTPLIHYVDTDPGKTPPSPEEKPAPNIPRKYRAQASSPLKATVKEGPNTFNFDMDTKP